MPPAALRPVELARWAWRQLTSMRTALLLLFLLTLAALPGSLVPQRDVDPLAVAQFAEGNPDLARWYERVALFDVYSSPWFAAIYLLLFVSLVGCVLPRSRTHLRAARARPPAAPRHLDRLPVQLSWDSDRPPSDIVAAAERELRSDRFRVVVAPAAAPSTSDRSAIAEVAAERGHWRETGNLLFHLSLLLLLVAVALGSLFGFKGSVLVVEDDAFSNTITAYDTFSGGAGFDDRSLEPFTVSLEELAVRYQPDGTQRGAPRDFRVALTYTATPDGPQRSAELRVNSPLEINGTKVFLLGNGYAPEFTVRDATGEVVFSGPVPFVPRDANMASTGVVKVPSAAPEQLGFEGLFLPTAVLDPVDGPISVFPDTTLPRAVLTAWTGELGVDDGTPQSVFTLDRSEMVQVTGAGGQPLAQSLAPGATMTLPDGRGSITFDGVRRWASLRVGRDPGTGPALAASVVALGGLMLSLFVRRRRVWVRATAIAGGRTLIEIAALQRSEADSREVLAEEVADLAHRLGRDGTRDA